jgi:universal stress protein A
MSGYKHILLAVDFGDETRQIAERAADLAQRFNARLTLLHVVEVASLTPVIEQIPPLAPGMGIPPESQIPVESNARAAEQAFQHARSALAQLAENLAVENPEQLVMDAPSTKEEIHRVAKENAVDLIVVGSHGRHGLALLLGSTANAVLHDAPCDVLAVRIRS